MLLLHDAQVEGRFSLFGDSANLDERYVHALRRMYNRIRNHFGCTRRNSLLTGVMWNLVSVRLLTMLVSV
jgi:hypothetical protein